MLALTLRDRVCIVAKLTNGSAANGRAGGRNRRTGMRWYVDISTIGPDKPTHRHCVEAEQWQKALQAVRAQRGDEAPFGNFSIELLDDGYRAIDPATRTRYVVQRAPDDADLTPEATDLHGKAEAKATAPAATPAARK
ncbi:MAG: hypothetical protein JNK04_23135, partial [Myxococcales bacterium]|nr:hypothetical protein [Myxococcales bacterium]